MEMTARRMVPKGRWIGVGLVFVLAVATMAQQPGKIIVRNGLIVTAVSGAPKATCAFATAPSPKSDRTWLPRPVLK